MKTTRRFFLSSLAIWLLSTVLGAAPVTLTLNDLQGHPERWPAKMALPQDFKFQGGASARKGQVVQVIDLKGGEVVVDAGNDLVFTVPAAGSEFVALANAAWSKLTPAQQNLDAAAIMADPSLWPARVKNLSAFGLQNGTKVPAGTEFELVAFDREGLSLSSPKYAGLIGSDFKDTDLLARARELVLVPANQRPSRIAAALKGNLVDGTGKLVAASLDDTQIFALYYGASWCGPCRKFSPGFVKYINQVAAANPKLTVVLMSNDKSDADMFGYMKAESMPWSALPLSKLQKTPLFQSYTKGYIPQLVIVDRSGKILADSYQGARYIGPEVALKGLTKLVDSGAAR